MVPRRGAKENSLLLATSVRAPSVRTAPSTRLAPSVRLAPPIRLAPSVRLAPFYLFFFKVGPEGAHGALEGREGEPVALGPIS